MGYDVHLHVCIPVTENEPVARLAKKWLAALSEIKDINLGCREALWFLEDLAGRTGRNPGPKGGLSLWGIVGNYTDPEEFAEFLRPFWLELLSGSDEDYPCEHERVVVLFEREQTEAAGAIEIGWDLPNAEPGVERKLLIRVFEKLPFSWQQF